MNPSDTPSLEYVALEILKVRIASGAALSTDAIKLCVDMAEQLLTDCIEKKDEWEEKARKEQEEMDEALWRK